MHTVLKNLIDLSCAKMETLNREGKLTLLRHVAVVAKSLDDDKK